MTHDRAEREDARILAMGHEALLAECRKEGIDPDRIPAEMDAALELALIKRVSLGALFNALVRCIDFDGADPRTFTLAELQRAIKGAEFP